jgi:hypothetical protein
VNRYGSSPRPWVFSPPHFLPFYSFLLFPHGRGHSQNNGRTENFGASAFLYLCQALGQRLHAIRIPRKIGNA